MKKELSAFLQSNQNFKISIRDILYEKQLADLEQNMLLLLRGQQYDAVDEALSFLLLQEFLKNLALQEIFPKRILLSEKAVLFNQENSPLLYELRRLEQKNIEILTCKTSAEYYNINGILPCGRYVDMEEITELICFASKIIQW